MENKATKRTNRLGRGLSALIPDISTEIDKKDIITIDLKNIYPNQDQPRRVFDEEKILPSWKDKEDCENWLEKDYFKK